MGYFPNGTEGEAYQEQFCDRCWHDRNGQCPILALHYMHNYDERNKPESYLHVLIPRTEDKLGNEQCTMFLPADAVRKERLPAEVKLSPADEKFLQGQQRP